jgi:limonene-1,2-epoxide hydrolase
MNNQQTILDFFKAIEVNEKSQILSYFTPDALYHNIPMDPAQGHDAIWAALAPIQEISEEIEWVVHNISSDDAGNVYTERTDRFKVQGTWREVKVMGIFEVSDGKITGWRDYFDLQQVMAALSRPGRLEAQYIASQDISQRGIEHGL